MHTCKGQRRRIAVTTLVTGFLLLLAVPRTATAAEEEHTFTVAPRYVAMLAAEGGDDLHAVGASFGYRYGLTDFWALMADATYAFFPAEIDHFASIRFGATYTIDALEWVPWLGVAAGGYVVPDATNRFDGGVSVGGGLDYRPQREFSVGVDVWYHALFSHLDQIPATLVVGLRLSWYRR